MAEKDAMKRIIEDRKKRDSDPRYRAMHEDLYFARKQGGGSGGAASDTREMQLGAELDPKAMMKPKDMKKGGKVNSASKRADGCAQRGKTRGKML